MYSACAAGTLRLSSVWMTTVGAVTAGSRWRMSYVRFIWKRVAA